VTVGGPEGDLGHLNRFDNLILFAGEREGSKTS